MRWLDLSAGDRGQDLERCDSVRNVWQPPQRLWAQDMGAVLIFTLEIGQWKKGSNGAASGPRGEAGAVCRCVGQIDSLHTLNTDVICCPGRPSLTALAIWPDRDDSMANRAVGLRRRGRRGRRGKNTTVMCTHESSGCDAKSGFGGGGGGEDGKLSYGCDTPKRGGRRVRV